MLLADSAQEIDADQTAITAMQMILSWQPAVDESKTDALVRAKPYLGGAEGQQQGVQLAHAVVGERAAVARDGTGDHVVLAGAVEQRQAAPALVRV